jgi:hypothetical protein
MQAINPSLLVLARDVEGAEPSAATAIVLCPACAAFVPVSLVGARVQACEVCSSEVVVRGGDGQDESPAQAPRDQG